MYFMDQRHLVRYEFKTTFCHQAKSLFVRLFEERASEWGNILLKHIYVYTIKKQFTKNLIVVLCVVVFVDMQRRSAKAHE